MQWFRRPSRHGALHASFIDGHAKRPGQTRTVKNTVDIRRDFVQTIRDLPPRRMVPGPDRIRVDPEPTSGRTRHIQQHQRFRGLQFEDFPDFECAALKPSCRRQHGLGPIAHDGFGAGRRIIVIDDIMSSGSSVLSAREILGNRLGTEVVGITFLGPL